MFVNWYVDYNEYLSMLKDGMESSVLCFSLFKPIEAISQVVELIDTSYGNKILTIQE